MGQQLMAKSTPWNVKKTNPISVRARHAVPPLRETNPIPRTTGSKTPIIPPAHFDIQNFSVRYSIFTQPPPTNSTMHNLLNIAMLLKNRLASPAGKFNELFELFRLPGIAQSHDMHPYFRIVFVGSGDDFQ